MTDHITEAERFRNQYMCIRTPGQLPTTADVLALANYHATMAVHDAIQGLAPNTPPDAPRCPHSHEQPEPGQVDGYEATGPAKPRSTMRHLAEHDWQEYYELTETMNSLLARAEKAEYEANDPYSHANQAAKAWSRVCAHPALSMDLLPEADHTYAGSVFERITQLSDRATKAEAERDHLVGVIDGAEQRTRMAEVERDAILADLRSMRSRWSQHEHKLDQSREQYDQGAFSITKRTVEALTDIIDRHTPEG